MYKTRLHKNGFSLGEVLITIFITAVIAGVAAPFMTKKETNRNYEDNVVKCVVVEQAASLTSTACETAIDNAKYRKKNAHKTLFYYADHGTAAQQTAARKVLRQACDEGADKICKYFIDNCRKDSDFCDIAGSDYDIDYYFKLPVNSSNIGRMRIRDIAKPWYELGNTNIVTAVDNACCDGDTLNTACDINGTTACSLPKWGLLIGAGADDNSTGIALDQNNNVFIAQAFNINTTGIPSGVNKIDRATNTLKWNIVPQDASNDRIGYKRIVHDQNNSLYLFSSEMTTTYLTKITDNGDTASLAWHKSWQLSINNYPYYSDMTYDGGYIYVLNEISWQPHIMKFDPDGNKVWEFQYQKDMGNNAAINVNNSDIYIITEKNNGELRIIKAQYNGSTLVTQWAYEISPQMYIKSIKMGENNELYLCGRDTAYKGIVIKLQDNGTDASIDWSYELDTGGEEHFEDIEYDGNGNIYVVGYSDGTGKESTYNVMVVLKLADSGSAASLTWQKAIYGQGDSRDDYGFALEIGSDEEIYVTGEMDLSGDAGWMDIPVFMLNRYETSNMSSFSMASLSASLTPYTDDGWASYSSTITDEPLNSTTVTPNVIDLSTRSDVHGIFDSNP